jgi:hypothetical protein
MLPGRIRRRSTTAPHSSSAATLQLFLPKSMPIITVVMARLSLLAPASYAVSESWGGPFHKALRAAEQDRPDVAARRKLWRAAQPFIDPEALVFLDETGVNTKMARLYGWAPVGERCRDSAPFGHWKTMTFIAGLRLTGMTAPWVLDAAMDGDAFRTCPARPRADAEARRRRRAR